MRTRGLRAIINSLPTRQSIETVIQLIASKLTLGTMHASKLRIKNPEYGPSGGINYVSKHPYQVKEIPPSHSFGQKGVEGIVHHLVGVLIIRVGDQKESFSCLRSDNNKI